MATDCVRCGYPTHEVYLARGAADKDARVFSYRDVEALISIAQLGLRKGRIDGAAVAATPELASKLALVVYFENEQDREEFMAAIHEAKPNMRTVKI